MVEFHFNTNETPPLKVKKQDKQKIIWLSDTCIRTPYNLHYDFYDLNRDLMGDYCSIKVIDTSIKKFYQCQYSGKCSQHLTEKFIYDAVNRNDNIIVIEPNINNLYCNSLGMTFPDFERYLYHEDQDEPWQKDEIKAFQKVALKYQNTYMGDVFNQIVKKQLKWIEHKNADPQIIDNAKNLVKSFEQTVQNEINKYKNQLLQYQKTLPKRDLNCGFASFYTTNQKILNAYDILIHNNIRHNQNLNIDFPDDYMNCSNNYALLDKLKELSQTHYLDDIYVVTMLD